MIFQLTLLLTPKLVVYNELLKVKKKWHGCDQ